MIHPQLSRRFLGASMAIVISSLLAVPSLAQGGYRIGEGRGTQSQNVIDPEGGPDSGQSNAPASPQTSGPVRMARISFINGSVTWRPDPSTEWANASVNMPLREGAEIWVGDGSRAELQFDDGSVIRFGSGAVATLQTLFSDSQGEFTELKLTDGLASMDLRTDHSIYQIDTPKGAIKSTGPSMVRVGVDEDVEIGVRLGTATLDGVGGKIDLRRNDYLDVTPTGTNYQVEPLPEEDSWDKFTDERHELLAHQDPNLPDNLKFVAGDLDNYGGWRNDAEYGQVWVPQEPASWTPYHDGNWVWCNPFGWTWVGAEPWGWAPYHYGSWIHRGFGWGWVPGPVSQYWSPGVVNFCETDGVIGWTPLAPFECHYPVGLSLGVWGGGWSTWFSIGYCGAWFPGNSNYCVQRPWNNRWLNGWHGSPSRYGEVFGHHEGGFANNGFHFQPANASFATITSSRENFGVRGSFTRVTGHDGQDIFARGQSFSAPARGQGFTAGPSNIRPSSSSWSASKSFTSRPENTGIMNRPVYRGTSPVFGRSSSQSSSDAAKSARESLGWSRSPSGEYGTRGQSNPGSQGSAPYSRGTTGSSSTGTTSHTPAKSWSVPDHSGWSHVHSDNHSAPASSGGSSRGGGSPSSGGSSGGSRGGGGGGNGRGGH